MQAIPEEKLAAAYRHGRADQPRNRDVGALLKFRSSSLVAYGAAFAISTVASFRLLFHKLRGIMRSYLI
jgi:hypothetical protein